VVASSVRLRRFGNAARTADDQQRAAASGSCTAG
jgi:hypothetical protein